MSVSPSNSPRSSFATPLISVLDQAPVSEGMSSAQALQNALDLASLADRLGYYRYWVAEHHGTTSLACASPEVLIGPIAAATSRLRLGSGGIVQHAQRVVSGAHRSRAGSRAGQRCADRVGLAARPAPAPAR